MGDQENLESQSSKDRAWTTEEIRKHSSNWTLAGDVGLFNLLNEFSHQIISRTHEVENAVDYLVHETKMTTAKINNVLNDFHMLSNLQFVENRVYDEEPVTEDKPVAEKTKEQREAEMLPKIVQAIELGLAVLDTAFDRINVNEISDSEDEEDISSEGRTILEPKDPYEHRPLPYIIGCEEFMKCDYAGLKELVEDDAPSFSEESSISETDETSSDEGEQLPLDDDRFSDKHDELSQNISDRISSSDESELFGSEKEVNGFGSETSLEAKPKEKNIQRISEVQPEKVARQNSVSSLQAKLKLPQVLPVPKLQEKKESKAKLKLPQVLPVPKLQEKEESDDLFAADEENSDDESPFRKKTGLFVSEIKFGEEKDDDLFGGDLFGKSPSEDVKEIKPVAVPKAVPKKPPNTMVEPETKKLALFDNDEDSEDDIFNTLMKTKKPNTTKTSNAGSEDSSEKADTSSTPSSAPSLKPSGNAFGFATGSGNNGSLFGDDSDGDDLFSSKNSQGKKFEFDSSEKDDLFGTAGFKVSKESKVLSDPKPSLFEEKKPIKKEVEKPHITRKKTKDSIFEDSDSSDQEKAIPIKSPLSVSSQSKKEINLFDDDDLEDDIFSKVSKESKPAKTERKSKPISLFEDSEEIVSKKSKPEKSVEKSKTISLFDDTEEESAVVLPSLAKTQNKLSLFDDSDNFDLFAPKPSVTQKEPKAAPPLKPSLTKTETKAVEPPKPSVTETKPNAVEFPKPSIRQAESKSVEFLKPSVTETEPNAVEFPKPSIRQTEPKSVEPPKLSIKTEQKAVEPPEPVNVSSPAKDVTSDSQISFDTPVDSSNVLSVINKGRAKITTKRRKPTRQGRLAAIGNSEKEAEIGSDTPAAKSNLGALNEDSGSLFSVTKPAVKPEPPRLDHKSQEKKKMDIMSQLMSEVTTSKIAQRKAVEKEDDDEDEIDIFSEAAKKDRSKSSFSFLPPEENGIASMFPIEKKEDKMEDSNISKSDSFEDDFFTEPAFQNFRASISHKESVLDLDDDDDDDDDLFSAIKSNVLPKPKTEAPDSNDLFGDDTDIFADVQKEKYEMFPNQVYDDEDDDIFSNVSNTGSSKSSSKTNNSSTIKKVETQQVNAFDDPLTGLLGEE